jgi:hypothetical protein
MLDRAPVYEAMVTVHAPLAQARARLGDAASTVEAIDEDTCRIRTRPDTAAWLAARLGSLGYDFEVHEPPELVDHLHTLAVRLHHATTHTVA